MFIVHRSLTPQVPLDVGLPAWELVCHTSMTGTSQVSHHLRLSVSDRLVPLLTPLSDTQRARRRSRQVGVDHLIRRVCHAARWPAKAKMTCDYRSHQFATFGLISRSSTAKIRPLAAPAAGSLLRDGFGLTIWMQLPARACSRSTGAVHRVCGRSPKTAIARMGLLHLAAVRDDSGQQEHCQARLDT